MKVLSGYGDKFKEVGTVRLVDNKIVYDLPEDYVDMMGDPKGWEPEEFMEMLKGRFRQSSTIAFKLEKGE